MAQEQKAKAIRRSGTLTIDKAKEYLNFLADLITTSDSCEYTGKTIVKDGEVKTWFNIDSLQLQVVVKQEGLTYECK